MFTRAALLWQPKTPKLVFVSTPLWDPSLVFVFVFGSALLCGFLKIESCKYCSSILYSFALQLDCICSCIVLAFAPLLPLQIQLDCPSEIAQNCPISGFQ